MARHESSREDLLRDAKALVERVELAVLGQAAPVVAGFRAAGQASLYFGEDPAYHFTARGELRRAFVDRTLYKAEGGRLVGLARERSSAAVTLFRRELEPGEAAAFLGEATRRLEALREALAAGKYEVLRQVPAEARVVERLRTWLDEHGAKLAVAQRPNVG
jgi:hypothetical protein